MRQKKYFSRGIGTFKHVYRVIQERLTYLMNCALKAVEEKQLMPGVTHSRFSDFCITHDHNALKVAVAAAAAQQAKQEISPLI